MSQENSDNYYDCHTLFIKCDCASVEQIHQSFQQALTSYQTATNNRLGCRFRVNLVENREGKSFGIAFVFVTKPEVYYMLLGKNPDGSDRVEYRDDPSWMPPVDGSIVNDAGWSSISAPIYTTNMSWAEMTELDQEYEKQVSSVKKSQTCPKIPVTLEPLMTLPPYTLTEKQTADKRNKIITENEGKRDFDPSLVEIPKFAYLTVERAMVSPVEDGRMANILKCKDVPEWISKNDIREQFIPYASDSFTVHERFIKGCNVQETYPFVNINEQRVAFVIFDPETHDAQFALHMMKKTVIRKNGSTATLIFNHSYCTKRDMMAEISHKPREVKFPPRESKPHNKHTPNNSRTTPRNTPHGGNAPAPVRNTSSRGRGSTAPLKHNMTRQMYEGNQSTHTNNSSEFKDVEVTPQNKPNSNTERKSDTMKHVDNKFSVLFNEPWD